MTLKEELELEKSKLESQIHALELEKSDICKRLKVIREREQELNVSKLLDIMQSETGPKYFVRFNENGSEEIATPLNIDGNWIDIYINRLREDDDTVYFTSYKERITVNAFYRMYYIDNALTKEQYDKYIDTFISCAMINFYQDNIFEKVTGRKYKEN